MLKNKIFKYFTIELIKNFFIVLISISLLMLLTQAGKFLNIITEMGNSSVTYVKYLLLNYPKIIEKTLPLSYLIAIFFTISKLKNQKELEIFWYSGVSQFKIFKLIVFLTFFIFILYYLLSIFIGPYSSSIAREVLAKSDFKLINSLVKEKNFNSPLKNLNIYVDKNDKRGNLEKVFIFEKDRVISSNKGRVIKKENKIYLELSDGYSQEKTNEGFKTIKFEKTTFDFSKFKTKNLKVPKFSERNIIWLIKNINKESNRIQKDLRYEINKRLIKPFLIFILAAMSSFLLYKNHQIKLRINHNFVIFLSCFIVIIANEVLLGFSSKDLGFSIIYILIIFVTLIFLTAKHVNYFNSNYEK